MILAKITSGHKYQRSQLKQGVLPWVGKVESNQPLDVDVQLSIVTVVQPITHNPSINHIHWGLTSPFLAS
jgi:hypothetical protein